MEYAAVNLVYELVKKMLITCWSSLLGVSRKLRLWVGWHGVFVMII
jgi:hypothetical protein